MCEKLLTGDRQDPVERSRAIQDIVNSLALVPDKIERSLEIQSIALKLGIDQQIVNEEIRKAQRKQSTDRGKERERAAAQESRLSAVTGSDEPPPPGMESMPADLMDPHFDQDMPLPAMALDSLDRTSQERDIIRILVLYGQEMLTLEDDEEDEVESEGPKPEPEKITVEEYIVEDLSQDKYVQFEDRTCIKLWTLYQAAYAEERSLDPQSLLRHPDQSISSATVEMMSEKYELHRWEDRKIYPRHEREQMMAMVDMALDRFKLRTVQKLIRETQATIPAVQNDIEQFTKTVKRLQKLNTMKMRLSERFGSVILGT
jgi:DNA primase